MSNNLLINTHNLISHETLKSLICTQLDKIEESPKLAEILPPILIHGSPGIGKSQVIKDICRERNIEYIDVRLAQMEPCDIKGLPVPNRTESIMEWYINGTWPRNKDGKGIIFLDEITSADRSIQVAAYQLILDRCLGNLYKVPNGYIIVAAGNNTTDKAVATAMSSALANRFMHVEIEVDAIKWLNWAYANDVHPTVTSFINFRPEKLHSMTKENLERGWPSPRSWERVSNMLKIYNTIDESILRTIVYGLVGNIAGVEFMEYYKINEEFADILSIMQNPDLEIQIPTKADRAYALCSALIYLLWKADNDEDQNVRLDGFFRISCELTSDFASLAMMGAMQGPDIKTQNYRADRLFMHPMYAQWSNIHGKALKERMKKI